MISFQCSPHSTAAGIVSAFRQCANFQENYKNNLDKFVSVVVLDEIGLAEDSPKMPLKVSYIYFIFCLHFYKLISFISI
jgi:hypothetical protein